MTEKSRDGLFEWDNEKNKVNIIKHGILNSILLTM